MVQELAKRIADKQLELGEAVGEVQRIKAELKSLKTLQQGEVFAMLEQTLASQGKVLPFPKQPRKPKPVTVDDDEDFGPESIPF